eukprot:2086233-Rhodomonas_salina.1
MAEPFESLNWSPKSLRRRPTCRASWGALMVLNQGAEVRAVSTLRLESQEPKLRRDVLLRGMIRPRAGRVDQEVRAHAR